MNSENTKSENTTVVDSKEVGLAVGLILGEQLLGMRDLHYGLWTDGMDVSLANFSRAQQNYSEFLLSRIPPGTRRILDVGSGAGKLARELLSVGYQVDCVSPSTYLTGRLKDSLRERCHIYPVKFEALDTTQNYDLVLFSESFQYVNPEIALAKVCELLSPGGHLIISDFFRRNVPGISPLGGGHLIDEFRALLPRFPLRIVQETDLTAETAPTMEMFGSVLNDTARPLRDLVVGFVQHRHPILSKFLAWKLRKRFVKINDKYFSKKLSGASFSQFKTYRFYLLQRK